MRSLSAIQLKTKDTILLLIVVLMNLACKSQDKETYWKLTSIYREDKTPFKGFTVDAMKEMLNYNFHFIKRGDSLYFELPTKFKVDIRSFKSLSQLDIANSKYYEQYDQSFSNDVFRVKFRDNTTMSESRNTIMEFIRIGKEEFEADIHKVIAHQNEIRTKISELKKQLMTKPEIILNQLVKLPVKDQVIQDDKGNDIHLQVPQEIKLKESGDIKTQQFGAITIGTFNKDSKIYDVIHPQKDYRLKQLTIWVSTARADFVLANYKQESSDRIIFKEDGNSITGYELGYDPENEKAIISAVFCLKYKKVGETHVFIYGDVGRSQFRGNFNHMAEMNEILNFNCLIAENITVK